MTRNEAADLLDNLVGMVDDNQEHDYNTALKMAIEALSAQQWTPVTEALPEDEKDVLVTRHFLSDTQLKKNAITEAFYVEVAHRIGDEWTSYSDEYKIRRHLHKVIAWQPLPEPYKEKTKS